METTIRNLSTSARNVASVSAATLMLGFAASTALAAPTLAVDLSGSTTSGTISDGSNTVTFEYFSNQPAGTGILDPFVRVQANGTEQGYNTSIGSEPFQNKAGTWTHDVLFSALQLINGNYEFVLDINESSGGTNPLLSLDGLKLFAVSAGGQSSTSTDGSGNANGIIGTNGITGTLLWDMDALQDNYILLNYDRPGCGSGCTDMKMLLPQAVFAGVNTNVTPNFVLWSRFGLMQSADVPVPGSDSSDGFEEWATVTTTDNGGGGGGSVPEPATLTLVGLGLLGTALSRRRRTN